MDTKLTLKLDELVIAKAKMYARARKTSISALIENYLQQLTGKKAPDGNENTPLVKSLTGVIDLPKNVNLKKDYATYLSKKYK